jgi:acetyl esterase/lipase
VTFARALATMGQWLSRSAEAPNAALLSVVEPVPFEEAALQPDVRKHLAPLRSTLKFLNTWAPWWVLRMLMNAVGGAEQLQPDTPPLVETDITLLGDDLTPLAARIYEPPHLVGKPSPLLFYCHGGGWCMGSIQT